MDVEKLIAECFNDGDSWFPNCNRDLEYNVIALFGEVGEMANIVKKMARGDYEGPDKEADYREALYNLAMEHVDIFVYWANIAAILNYPFMDFYDAKRSYNGSRFGGPDWNPDDGRRTNRSDLGARVDEQQPMPFGATAFVPVNQVHGLLPDAERVEDPGQR